VRQERFTGRWLLAVVPVAAGVVFAGCDVGAATTRADGSFARTLQVEARPDIRVTSRAGHIHVASGPAGTVHVEATVVAHGTAWLVRETPAEQIARIEADPPIVQRGNSITIGEIDDPLLGSDVSINYEITAPSDARLVTSTRSGEQTIAAMRGPLDATSRAGTITVARALGPLRLESRSGDVAVEGEPFGGWRIDTRSGDVGLRVSSGVSYEVAVATRAGSIEARPDLQRVDRGGSRRFEGRVGEGGPRIEVQTRSGSVRLD
jgi:hypothetical protein